MSKTRFEKRMNKHKLMFIGSVCLWVVVVVVLLAVSCSHSDAQTDTEERTVTYTKKTENRELQKTSCDVNYDPPPVVSEYVERVVAAESRGESIEGQMAVAQCIRTTAEVTGQTPEQVVKVKNQYAQPVSASEVTDSVREACYRVFYIGESVVDDDIRYFYATTGDFYSAWHEENLEYVTSIGNHKFFK